VPEPEQYGKPPWWDAFHAGEPYPPKALEPSLAIWQLQRRKITCWEMAQVFLDNRDAHGLHDMGVEIQALDRAVLELEKVCPSLKTSPASKQP
jgi:hypothetical protein